MKIKISHINEYTYSEDVFFEPHFLRFKPKVMPYSSLKSFDLQVTPEPAGYSEYVDIENNHIRHCWFEGLNKKLSISVNSVIEVTEFNPFLFLIYPDEYLNIPFQYIEKDRQLLLPSLNAISIIDPIREFLKKLLKATNYQTINFLTELTKQIHNDFSLETRELGESLPPDHTFQVKKGSCRDLAWMQIHMLRSLGIAARFVSGYYFLNSEDPEFELHAWVEVFLPGAGWVGFDPAHGVLTGCFHIPTASSSFYENTMPVSGSIRGVATSILEHKLNITDIS